MAEPVHVEEAFKRIQAHKGVLGVVVINGDGVAIRSTFEPEATVQYAALVSRFAAQARSAVRTLDTENDLRFLRIRSAKHEIMIAPEFEAGHEYCLVVVQNPSAE